MDYSLDVCFKCNIEIQVKRQNLFQDNNDELFFFSTNNSKLGKKKYKQVITTLRKTNIFPLWKRQSIKFNIILLNKYWIHNHSYHFIGRSLFSHNVLDLHWEYYLGDSVNVIMKLIKKHYTNMNLKILMRGKKNMIRPFSWLQIHHSNAVLPHMTYKFSRPTLEIRVSTVWSPFEKDKSVHMNSKFNSNK